MYIDLRTRKLAQCRFDTQRKNLVYQKHYSLQRKMFTPIHITLVYIFTHTQIEISHFKLCVNTFQRYERMLIEKDNEKVGAERSSRRIKRKIKDIGFLGEMVRILSADTARGTVYVSEYESLALMPLETVS